MSPLGHLSPAERMHVVYAAYGKAMIYAHGLESRLAMILIMADFDKERPEWAKKTLVEEVESLTLGGLIRRFESKYTPSEEIQEELCNCLHFRNELAHRISKTIVLKTVEAQWEADLAQELDEITGYFQEARHSLQPYYAAERHKMHMSPQEVDAFAKKHFPGISGAA